MRRVGVHYRKTRARARANTLQIGTYICAVLTADAVATSEDNC